MIRDITLGQYFPGDSWVHKLDPRIKIIATLLFIIEPVSYTHLDVYKRQPKTKAGQEKMGIALAKLAEEDPTFKTYTNADTCLLYTSTDLVYKEILTEQQYREKKDEYGDRFKAAMGAEAVKKLQMCIRDRHTALRLQGTLSAARRRQAMKVLKRSQELSIQ